MSFSLSILQTDINIGLYENTGKFSSRKLLKIKAVKLQPANPFTWASGWKSPIYNDNRKTLSYPVVRSFIKLELARVISENSRT